MKTYINSVVAILLISASSMMLLSNAQAAQNGAALLQITLDISETNRPAAVGVFKKYKQPFLDKAPGAKAKELLVRGEDVQVFHEFSSLESAQAYLTSELFSQDVVGELKPLLNANPEIRIYMKF